MSRLRTRLERLEKRLANPGGINWPKPGGINWANLWRCREDIVPDGIVDWDALFEPCEPWSAATCPIERAIADVANRASHAAPSGASLPAPADQL